MTLISQVERGPQTVTLELSWSEIIGVWRRKAWLIVLLALLGAGLSWAFSLTITRIYEAGGVLSCSTARTPVALAIQPISAL